MRAFDTNVLLRFLLDDDPHQTRIAERLFIECGRTGDAIFISAPVLCELVWFLRKEVKRSNAQTKNWPKPQIVNILEALTRDRFFRIEHEPEVLAAVDSYRTGPGDFADYLIGNLARRAGCRDTATFDKKLGGEPGFTIL